MAAPKILLKRGSTEARLTFIPEMGELILDKDTMKIYVGDGETPGGILVNGSRLAQKAFDEEFHLKFSRSYNKSIMLVDDYKEII